MEVPIPIARFSARATLRRRRVVPYSHSLYLARVVLGRLVIDASGFPADPGWTVGVIEAAVLGGQLEIVVPEGVEVRGEVRCLAGGRVRGVSQAHDDRAHILLRGTVLLGRLSVRTDPP